MADAQNNLEHFKKMAEANGEAVAPEIAAAFEQTPPAGDPPNPPVPPSGDGQPPAGDPPTPPAGGTTPETDIDDAALKKRNLNIDNLDQLKNLNPDNPDGGESEDAPEVKKAKIKEFAKTKQINAELFDQFEEDSNKSSIEVMFQVYLNERKNEINGEGEEYTEEELREEFEIEHNLNNDPDSPVYKRSLRNLDVMKNIYMRDTYKDLTNVESEYEADSNSRIQKANYEIEVSTAKTKLAETGLTYSIKLPGAPDGEAPLEIKLPTKLEKLDGIQVPIGTEDVLSEVTNQFIIKNIGSIIYEACNTFHAEMLKREAAELKGIDQRQSGESSTGMIVNEQFRSKFKEAGIKVAE